MSDLIYPEPPPGPCICWVTKAGFGSVTLQEEDCPRHGHGGDFRNDTHRHRSSDGVEYSHRHKSGYGRHVHVNKGKLDRMMAE